MFGWLYEWLWEFVGGINYIFEWLITPFEIGDLNVAPIYLVVGATAITGLIRRIL